MKITLKSSRVEALKRRNFFRLLALNLAFLILNSHAALVTIPLGPAGLVPATNRWLTVTPYSVYGPGYIPLTADRSYTNTDSNGNVVLSLPPGIYQVDVKPVWGQVGTTEFYFYVDPSNAVQSAYTNQLTPTPNTFPPPQYAYPASASDARYAMAAAVYSGVPFATNAQNAQGVGGIPAGGFMGVNTNVIHVLWVPAGYDIFKGDYTNIVVSTNITFGAALPWIVYRGGSDGMQWMEFNDPNLFNPSTLNYLGWSFGYSNDVDAISPIYSDEPLTWNTTNPPLADQNWLDVSSGNDSSLVAVYDIPGATIPNANAWNSSSNSLDIYVDSNGGSDGNPGTKDLPLQSLTLASYLVKSNGVIHLAAGIYGGSPINTTPYSVFGDGINTTTNFGYLELLGGQKYKDFTWQSAWQFWINTNQIAYFEDLNADIPSAIDIFFLTVSNAGTLSMKNCTLLSGGDTTGTMRQGIGTNQPVFIWNDDTFISIHHPGAAWIALASRMDVPNSVFYINNDTFVISNTESGNESEYINTFDAGSSNVWLYIGPGNQFINAGIVSSGNYFPIVTNNHTQFILTKGPFPFN